MAMSNLFGKRVLVVQGMKKKTQTLINSQDMCKWSARYHDK